MSESKPHSTQRDFASLRQVFVQYFRAMNELDWTCVNVTPGRSLDRIEEQLQTVEKQRDACMEAAKAAPPPPAIVDKATSSLLEQLEAYAKFDDVIAAMSDARRDDYRELQRLKSGSSPASGDAGAAHLAVSPDPSPAIRPTPAEDPHTLVARAVQNQDKRPDS